jgi:TonB family protein
MVELLAFLARSRGRILHMKKGFFSLVVLLLLSPALFAAGGNKGRCPPPPSISKEARANLNPSPNRTPPEAGEKFAGTVFVLLTISDKGYVCSAQLVQGFDKEADQRALEATRKWRFNPSTKDGHPVMVEMRVEVGFWRNANGELIFNVAEKTKK